MCVDNALIVEKVTVLCMHYKLYVQIIKVNLIAYPSVKRKKKKITKRTSTCDP